MALLVLAILASALSLPVFAESEPDGGMTQPGSEDSVPAEADESLVMRFFHQAAEAIRMLDDYYLAAFDHFGPLAPYHALPVVVLLLLLVFFGFRLFRVVSVLVGGVFGYAIGYAVYDFLMAWVGGPAWITNLEYIFRWVAVGVCALIGMVLAYFLRRVGFSAVAGFAAAAFISSYTANIWVLVGTFALIFLVGIFAIKPFVFVLSSFGGGILSIRLLIGENGFHPCDLNALLHVEGLNLLLIAGILVGIVGYAIQSRFNRGRRYY